MCLDCDYSYIEQTKRKLKTHLKEHINDFKKPTNTLSVISRRKLDHDHTIDWNNTIILNSEQSYYNGLRDDTYQQTRNGFKQTEWHRTFS